MVKAGGALIKIDDEKKKKKKIFLFHHTFHNKKDSLKSIISSALKIPRKSQ